MKKTVTRKTAKSCCHVLGLLCLLAVLPATAQRIDLAGRWLFALDPDAVLTANSVFTDSIELPGTTDTNRKGTLCQASSETTHLGRLYSYKGRAWYSRKVEVPSSWRQQRLTLMLERTKPTQVFVDGLPAGASNDISTPQVFEIGPLKPGVHTLTIMVDNGSGVPGQLYASSHAYTEDTQTNWNGIIGQMVLTTEDIVADAPAATTALTTDGHHFYCDGKRIFLRGRHDACVWPLTGHVPMDTDSWRHYMQVCRDYGLNHVRFHSWCPPEAAFLAADEAGIILQPELPFWGDFNAEDTTLMDFLLKEGENILRWYGHHPSFRMFALGNELWGSVEKMRAFVDHFRQMAPDKLYTFGSNYYLGYQGVQPGMDYFTTCRVGGEGWGQYSTHTRGSFSFADAADGGVINHFHPGTEMNFEEGCQLSSVPVVSHETAQFQSYPDFAETEKYTGVLRPYNMLEFSRRLHTAGMADQADDFHRASGRWAMQLYKQDIEMDLRTPSMAGFQLLDLQDYPGQGSAYVGVLDAFLDSKGLITPDEWRQFCAPVVPLAVMEKFCYQNDERLSGKLQIANYGGHSLKGRHVIVGVEPLDLQQTLVVSTDDDGLIDVGRFDFDLSGVNEPLRLNLYAIIEESGEQNTWPLWVYPARNDLEQLKAATTIARRLDDKLLQNLEQGADVLLMPQGDTVNTVGGLFQTDYWNYRMFKTIAENNHRPVSPGTLGLLCNPAHPLFDSFPTDEHTSWQWWPVVKQSRPFILDNTGHAYRPLVQVIDNIERNHKLGLVFEFAVGKGRLLVVMSDLEQAADYCEGRQFYLSVLRYMHSSSFAPKTSVTAAQLETLFTTAVAETQLKELNNISPY